jgi:hypothetical protein
LVKYSILIIMKISFRLPSYCREHICNGFTTINDPRKHLNLSVSKTIPSFLDFLGFFIPHTGGLLLEQLFWNLHLFLNPKNKYLFKFEEMQQIIERPMTHLINLENDTMLCIKVVLHTLENSECCYSWVDKSIT